MTDFERIFARLDSAHARYLVVGGVAVVLHGHPRFTADLDLVLWLEPSNVRLALDALRALDYRPRLPIGLEDFADPEKRRVWREERNMIAFTLWSPILPATEIDIFTEEPFQFDQTYSRGVSVTLEGGVHLKIPSIPDLIELKRAAGRPKDLEDIAALEAIEQIRRGP